MQCHPAGFAQMDDPWILDVWSCPLPKQVPGFLLGCGSWGSYVTLAFLHVPTCLCGGVYGENQAPIGLHLLK